MFDGYDAEEGTTSFTSLERFGEWMHSICVVTFDLELGQTIEVIYPDSSLLTPAEKLQICYLSFPDSNNNCSRDSFYHFRIKCPSVKRTKCVDRSNFESLIPPPMRSTDEHLFGFVHFRQQKDPTLPRGYFQKSVVLLTHLPFFELFSYIVKRVANEFFDRGGDTIEKACRDIDRWPLPTPNEVLCFSLMGETIRCRIPLRSDSGVPQMVFETVEFYTVSEHYPAMRETFFYDSLSHWLPHVHHLWELVLLGEPILVMAQTPAQCSQLVQSLTLLVWPMRYASDYRPYFTIHDADFNEISSKSQPPNIVIGVTNPFFFKSLKHWPHVLRVGDLSQQPAGPSKKKPLKKMDNGRKLESKPGFYTQCKSFLNADKSLLKKLLKIGERPDTVQNAILRRHFLELTQNFMMPLERYVMSLMPLQKQLSPFKPLPLIKSFSTDDFLAELSRSGIVGLKGDVRGLYRMFITKSSNFRTWLAQRIQEMDERLRHAHTRLLSTTALNASSLASCNQVEVVDVVLRLKERLEAADLAADRKSIREQLRNVMTSIDDELKSIFMSSEALKDIFHTV